MKVCKNCDIVKPDEDFITHYKSRGKDVMRKSNICNDCTAIWRREYGKRSDVVMRQRQYRKENPDKVKGWKKTDYERHKERVAEKSSEWYKKNKEYSRIKNIEWRNGHRDRVSELNKKRRDSLTDGYVIERLMKEFQFTRDELLSDYYIIELKRLQILLKRALGIKKGNKKN